MNHHPQEPPQELPSPFWSAHARPPEETRPVVTAPPRHLLKRGKLRTAEEVREAVQSRHPACIPLLVKALESKDHALCGAAFRGLMEFGDSAFYAVRQAVMEGRGRLREQAVVWLGDFGDSRAIPVLLKVIQKERRERIGTNILTTIGIGLWNVVVVGVWLAIEALCAAFLTPLGSTWGAEATERPGNHWNRDTTLRERAAEALGRIGDVRAIPPLVEMLQSKYAAVSGAATLALCRLLPLAASLRMEQSGSVSAELIPAIATLVDCPSTVLVRHALAALNAIGDGRALPSVERLTHYRTSSDTDRRQLAYEAQILLPVLRQRAAQDEYRRTLLRGAVAPNASPQELLRPAHGHTTGGTRPHELLRPASTTETETET
jgi:hypothetical protein